MMMVLVMMMRMVMMMIGGGGNEDDDDDDDDDVVLYSASRPHHNDTLNAHRWSKRKTISHQNVLKKKTRKQVFYVQFSHCPIQTLGNKKVFTAVLKEVKLSQLLTGRGSAFHRRGAVLEKDL